MGDVITAVTLFSMSAYLLSLHVQRKSPLSGWLPSTVTDLEGGQALSQKGDVPEGHGGCVQKVGQLRAGRPPVAHGRCPLRTRSRCA